MSSSISEEIDNVIETENIETLELVSSTALSLVDDKDYSSAQLLLVFNPTEKTSKSIIPEDLADCLVLDPRSVAILQKVSDSKVVTPLDKLSIYSGLLNQIFNQDSFKSLSNIQYSPGEHINVSSLSMPESSEMGEIIIATRGRTKQEASLNSKNYAGFIIENLLRFSSYSFTSPTLVIPETLTSSSSSSSIKDSGSVWYVTNDTMINELCKRIKDSNIKDIDIDCEFDHSYSNEMTSIGLIQLGLLNDIYVIDVKKCQAISSLSGVLSHGKIKKWGFGLDNDRILLFKIGIELRNFIDIKSLIDTSFGLHQVFSYILTGDISKKPKKTGDHNWNIGKSNLSGPIKDVLEVRALRLEIQKLLKPILDKVATIEYSREKT